VLKKSWLPDPLLLGIFGFAGVLISILLFNLGTSPARGVLMFVSYALHPIGIGICFFAPGGWRAHKVALVVNLLGLIALPAFTWFVWSSLVRWSDARHPIP
jgi:hypothetical protein